jgi:hypothetical protein
VAVVLITSLVVSLQPVLRVVAVLSVPQLPIEWAHLALLVRVMQVVRPALAFTTDPQVVAVVQVVPVLASLVSMAVQVVRVSRVLSPVQA